MDCTPTNKGFRRLQALLWFYEGKTYQEIAALSHFSERQILRYMQAFCEKLQSWQKDESIDLWFSDESGIEGDPRPRRQWTKIGSIRTYPYLDEHIRHNEFGALRPKDGRLFMLFNHCDSETFQAFLDTLAEENPRWPAAAPCW